MFPTLLFREEGVNSFDGEVVEGGEEEGRLGYVFSKNYKVLKKKLKEWVKNKFEKVEVRPKQ